MRGIGWNFSDDSDEGFLQPVLQTATGGNERVRLNLLGALGFYMCLIHCTNTAIVKQRTVHHLENQRSTPSRSSCLIILPSESRLREQEEPCASAPPQVC